MTRRALRALATIAATVLFSSILVGFSAAETGELQGRTVTASLNGQGALLSMPSGEGEPKGIVLWFHGQGGMASNRIEGPWLDSLRRDGWVIASGDLHVTSWGNAASTADARRLIDWAEEETGLDVKVWVSGSMGGAVSINALNFGIESPPCWYGVKPAISLTQMDKVPGGPGYIKSAYAGRVPPKRNPVRNLDTLSIATRYRVVASKDDHWVIYNQNTGPLIRTLEKNGADVSLLKAKGLHMDPSHFNSRDLVDFANSCVEPETGGDTASASG